MITPRVRPARAARAARPSGSRRSASSTQRMLRGSSDPAVAERATVAQKAPAVVPTPGKTHGTWGLRDVRDANTEVLPEPWPPMTMLTPRGPRGNDMGTDSSPPRPIHKGMESGDIPLSRSSAGTGQLPDCADPENGRDGLGIAAIATSKSDVLRDSGRGRTRKGGSDEG